MEKVKSIEQLGCYLVDKYGTQPQEGCWIIAVDTQLNILNESLVAMGTLNQVAIHPRDVYRHLIAINAYGFMMVHNHPSGNLTASSSDYQVLQQFILCSAIIKIHFFDFFIISRQGYRSYRNYPNWKEINLQRLLDIWTNMTEL